jgi:hypothetical protein
MKPCKKIAALSSLAVILAAGLATDEAAARGPAAQPSLLFRSVSGWAIVPVLVEGQGPFDFMLDTGTTTTILDADLARTLGLRAAGAVPVIDISDARSVPRVRLRSLAVPGWAMAGIDVLCDDLRHVRRVDSRVRGILGMDVLSPVNFVVSYDYRRLDIEDGGRPVTDWEGARLPFERSEGRILVRSQPASGRQRGLGFVLDSAANAVVLFGDAGDFGGQVDPAADGMLADTSSGRRLLEAGVLRRLHVGGQVLADLPVVFAAKRSGMAARTEDGLLPTRLFRAVYFNNQDGFVILNPRPVRPRRETHENSRRTLWTRPLRLS